MKSILYNFESEPQSKNDDGLYLELQECGYVDNHKRAILERLWDMNPHTTQEIQIAGGAQYNARIKELRTDGWEIVSERALGTPPKFFFRLLTRMKR